MTKQEYIQAIEDRQNMYVRQLAEIIKSDNLKKEIGFNSPTGTGKTVMVSMLIDMLAPLGFFFLITTLSKGGLNKQVEISLKKRVKSKEYIVYGVSSYKSNTKLQATNIINSIPHKKKLIWIRDEGHIRSNNWEKILAEKSYKVVNMSATNKQVDLQCNFTDLPILRTPFQLYGTPEEAVIKLLEIKKAHASVKKYNPCMIVRDVNGEVSKVFEYLAVKYSLEIIDITNKQIDIQDLCRNDNKYDIIINKLRITEGIDIPRASVFYIGNRPGNEATVIQLIGRVRRNALLWNNSIDIFQSKNKKLLEETLKTYIFYRIDGTSIKTQDNELCMELSDTISIDSIIPSRIEVINNRLLNGYRIAELDLLGDQKYSGILNIERENGLSVITNLPKLYERQVRTIEEFGWAFKEIVKDYELVKCSFDKTKYYRMGEQGLWRITTTVNDNIQFGKLLRFICDRYKSEIASVNQANGKQYKILFAKPMESGNRKFNVAMTLIMKYLTKYYISGRDFIYPFFEISKNAFETLNLKNYSEKEIILYAVSLCYRKYLTKIYGELISKYIPLLSAEEILNLPIDIKNALFEISSSASEKIKEIIFNKKSVEKTALLSPHLGTSKILHGVADVITEDTIILLSCNGKFLTEDIYKGLAYHFLSTKRYDLKIKKVCIFDCLISDYLLIDISEKNLTKLKTVAAKKISKEVSDFDIKLSLPYIRTYYSMYGKNLTINEILRLTNIISAHKNCSYCDNGRKVIYNQKELLRNLLVIGDSELNEHILEIIYRTPEVLDFSIKTDNQKYINQYLSQCKPNAQNLITAIEKGNISLVERLVKNIKIDVNHLKAALNTKNDAIIKTIISNLNITKRIANDIIRTKCYLAIEKMLLKIKPTSYNLLIAVKTGDYKTVELIVSKCNCIGQSIIEEAKKISNEEILCLLQNMLRKKIYVKAKK